MSPKEKAKELFKKMWDKFPAQSAIHFDLKPFVKDCVLIAVDEIMKENEANNVSNEIGYTIATFMTNQQYWEEVKAEIKRL